MKNNNGLPMENCTGCTACMSACPKSAITMVTDSQGFLRPKIDVSYCVDCGICERTCPVIHKMEVSKQTEVYAAYALDELLRQDSSSGAIFPLLAKYVLSHGGIVFGAAFDDKFTVRHKGIEKVDNLSELCSSKYVQSEVGNTFLEAKSALDMGRLVYYSGTPCQIAGLRSYLKRDYENLITQDLVCHSVPSPRIWNDYKKSLEESYGGKTTDFSFRFKKKGLEDYYICAVFDNGSEYLSKATEDPYQRGFIRGLYSRLSCFSCPFKGIQRASDITLADFWGVQDLFPQAVHPDGTSLVFIHSEKGGKLFREIAADMKAFPTEAETALTFNQAAYTPAKKTCRYEEFWKCYNTMSFAQLVDCCCLPTVGEKMTARWKRSILYRGMHRFYRIFRQKIKGER